MSVGWSLEPIANAKDAQPTTMKEVRVNIRGSRARVSRCVKMM